MDMSNVIPTQGARVAVSDVAMESGHWRAQLQRQKIVNKAYVLIVSFFCFFIFLVYKIWLMITCLLLPFKLHQFGQLKHVISTLFYSG
ncbi:hypothetical protein Hanom_Chr07g00584341 [Helianthus anomalus]